MLLVEFYKKCRTMEHCTDKLRKELMILLLDADRQTTLVGLLLVIYFQILKIC